MNRRNGKATQRRSDAATKGTGVKAPGHEGRRAQRSGRRDEGRGTRAAHTLPTFPPSHVPACSPPDAAGEALLDVLAGLYDALKQLATLADRKLEALRDADAEALHGIAAREHAALERIGRLDAQRSAAVARLAQALRLEAGAEATLSQLASCCPQPLASRLAARAAGLRDVATVLRDRNAQAACVARDLYTHVRGVLHEVARGCQETVGYGPDGPRQHQRQNWIDAVG